MMKLVAGLGSVDEYTAYVQAGADEVFIGFVPEAWQSAHGLGTPLNRREVCYYNVQIGSRSELEILKEQEELLQVPVTIAFNGLQYAEDLYPAIETILRECLEIGFGSVILADPGLLLYLKESGLSGKLSIHVSGEIGAINRYTIARLKEWGADRVIFHRKVTTEEMQSMTAACPELSYEAFLMNEMCQFHGGYCNSLHCDELVPVCREKYRLAGISGASVSEGMISDSSMGREKTAAEDTGETYIPGSSGCGLCALWKLRQAQVTHLKIVGRGAHPEDMLTDLRVARSALGILEKSTSEEQYIEQMKQQLFPGGCSGNCYYRALRKP